MLINRIVDKFLVAKARKSPEDGNKVMDMLGEKQYICLLDWYFKRSHLDHKKDIEEVEKNLGL